MCHNKTISKNDGYRFEETFKFIFEASQVVLRFCETTPVSSLPAE